jgi:hypothetical protein
MCYTIDNDIISLQMQMQKLHHCLQMQMQKLHDDCCQNDGYYDDS